MAFVVVAGAVVVLAWVGAAGLGVASALFGHGWVLPASSTDLAAVVGGLLTGHPGQGLPAADAARVPGPGAVYGCVLAAELAALLVAGTVGVLVGRYRRPGDARRGMATRHEAAQVLGVSRLRAARGVIRPDLSELPRWWWPATGTGGSQRVRPEQDPRGGSRDGGLR